MKKVTSRNQPLLRCEVQKNLGTDKPRIIAKPDEDRQILAVSGILTVDYHS